jgi:hypothetical protein
MVVYVGAPEAAIRVDGDAIRVRAMRADYPSKEAHHQALELSFHIIMQFRDIAAQTFAMCEHLATEAGKTLDIEHVPNADFDPEREH